MEASTKHAYVTGGDSICDAIFGQLQDAAEVVAETAQEHLQALHQQMQGTMQDSERWRPVAGGLTTWKDEEGNATIGFPEGSEDAVRASRLEYGDDTDGPDPRVRMGVIGNISAMGWSMADTFRRRGF